MKNSSAAVRRDLGDDRRVLRLGAPAFGGNVDHVVRPRNDDLFRIARLHLRNLRIHHRVVQFVVRFDGHQNQVFKHVLSAAVNRQFVVDVVSDGGVRSEERR